MERSTVRWCVVENLMITFSTPGTLTDPDFNVWMKEFRAKPFTRYLNTSVGYVNLTSVQRKLAAEAMKEKAVKTSVVTDEMLLRGMVTAVAWLGADVKAFSWADLAVAIRHLDVVPATEVRAIDAVQRMRGPFTPAGAGAHR